MSKAGLKRQRPKLDEEKLLGVNGISHVYCTFPEAFRKVYRGAGHEASDLGRFLDLYRGWHRRMTNAGSPALSFDVFVEKVAALGRKRPIQGAVRSLREKHAYGGGVDDDSGRPGSPAATHEPFMTETGPAQNEDQGGDGEPCSDPGDYAFPEEDDYDALFQEEEEQAILLEEEARQAEAVLDELQ